MSVAVLRKLIEENKIEKDERIVCYVTGNGLKATEAIMGSTAKTKCYQAGYNRSFSNYKGIMLAKVEFVVPSVLNKGQERKRSRYRLPTCRMPLQKVSEQMGEDFRRRVFDHNGKPRSLINIYINGKNVRFSGVTSSQLKDGDSISTSCQRWLEGLS